MKGSWSTRSRGSPGDRHADSRAWHGGEVARCPAVQADDPDGVAKETSMTSTRGVPPQPPPSAHSADAAADAHAAPGTSCPDDGLPAFLGARPRLFGIACRMLGSAAEAEDLVQDVWVR